MFFNFDRMSFQILSVARIRHPNGIFHVSPRPYAAISVRRRGQGAFCFENTSFVANKGDITFIPSYVGYEVEYEESEIIVIHLIDCNYTEAENVTPKHPDYIALLFKQLLEDWERGCAINLSKSSVYQLLAKTEEDSLSDINDTFAKCNMYLQEHFSEHELKIADICTAGSISEAGLYRYFMAYYGMSPKQYLLKLRLNYAMELLLKGNTPIQEVAKITGFQDAKYFSRIFKKTFGVPPSRYFDLK